MKLLPIVSLSNAPPQSSSKSTLPRKVLQHIGQLCLLATPENVREIKGFVNGHFGLCRIYVDVTRLNDDGLVDDLLDAGVAAVFVRDGQGTGIPEARKVTSGQRFASVADILAVNEEKDVYLECDIIIEASTHADRTKLANTTLLIAVEKLTLEDAGPEPTLFNVADLLMLGVTSDRPDTLIPTLVTGQRNESLGLVYSSRESVLESLKTGKGVYQSRKRGLWYKGATSGDTQRLVRISYDCDADCLKFVVVQEGRGFCHLPQTTCFGNLSGLSALEATLLSRKESAPPDSYTARLFNDDKLLRAKILEEAEELCDATTKDEVAFEAADLIYFCLTRCISKGVMLKDVEDALDRKAMKIKRRTGNAKPKYEDAISAKEEKVVAQVREMGDNPPIDDKRSLSLKRYPHDSVTKQKRLELMQRPIKNTSEITKLVLPIIEAVRTRGDAALLEFTRKFDGASLSSPLLKAPFDPALMSLESSVKAAIDQAFANIKKFHTAQLEKPISVETMPGVVCSRFSKPIEKVGLYVPGGTAVLPSTAMMLGVPASVAGCPHIIIASPPRKDGTVNPEIVYIAHKVGAESILLAGGAQAVAAFAYGTESVRKVDKILGPGNQFVTAAKGIVSGDAGALVSIDMPAGPSEVLVIADGSADPAFVASDLLSQAEHGADSQSVLVGVNLTEDELGAIERELNDQANRLPRVEILRKSIAHSYTYNARDLEDALAFSNEYAPEHLIVYTANSARDVQGITNAGSIFVGPYSPVACGDYASGTNHTLPTYGYAKQYSGVNTGSFMKAITSQEITREGLKELGKVVMRLAEVEGLEAHRNSVQVRLQSCH